MPEHDPQPIEALKPNTVIRFPNGELGSVLMRQRKENKCFVQLADSMLLTPYATPVEVVATPDELALAYIMRPAMRPMVAGALAEARRSAVMVLDKMFRDLRRRTDEEE